MSEILDLNPSGRSSFPMHGNGSNMDLKPFIGQNILPMGGETEEQDPFCGEIPQDSRGYTAYRRFYERKMDNLVGGAKTLSAHMSCEYIDENGKYVKLHHQKPAHEGAGIVIACNHFIHQDPANPEGGKFYPLHRGKNAGFFLCKTCMRLEQRKKLNFEFGVSMKCSKCVLDAIMVISAQHPDRFVNLASL